MAIIGVYPTTHLLLNFLLLTPKYMVIFYHFRYGRSEEHFVDYLGRFQFRQRFKIHAATFHYFLNELSKDYPVVPSVAKGVVPLPVHTNWLLPPE